MIRVQEILVVVLREIVPGNLRILNNIWGLRYFLEENLK